MRKHENKKGARVSYRHAPACWITKSYRVCAVLAGVAFSLWSPCVAAQSGPRTSRVRLVAYEGRQVLLTAGRYVALVPLDKPWDEPLREALAAPGEQTPWWEGDRKSVV